MRVRSFEQPKIKTMSVGEPPQEASIALLRGSLPTLGFRL